MAQPTADGIVKPDVTEEPPAAKRAAAAAVTVAQVAVGLLRQQLPTTTRVHGVVTHGGGAYNVVPALTRARYGVRAVTGDELTDVGTRVEACLRAGALAAGCEIDVTRPEPDYADFRTDEPLLGWYADNARLLGRPQPVESGPVASTDMGNVSQVVPAIHPMLDIDSRGSSPHQPEFAARCVLPAATQAMLAGATAMAWTAVDVAAAPRRADPGR